MGSVYEAEDTASGRRVAINIVTCQETGQDADLLLLLALAHQRQGQTGEARRWLQQARPAAGRSSESWVSRLAEEFLRREVETGLKEATGKKPTGAS
jgi:hypothetical protein